VNLARAQAVTAHETAVTDVPGRRHPRVRREAGPRAPGLRRDRPGDAPVCRVASALPDQPALVSRTSVALNGEVVPFCEVGAALRQQWEAYGMGEAAWSDRVLRGLPDPLGAFAHAWMAERPLLPCSIACRLYPSHRAARPGATSSPSRATPSRRTACPARVPRPRPRRPRPDGDAAIRPPARPLAPRRPARRTAPRTALRSAPTAPAARRASATAGGTRAPRPPPPPSPRLAGGCGSARSARGWSRISE
jgi:hypothetical protein